MRECRGYRSERKKKPGKVGVRKSRSEGKVGFISSRPYFSVGGVKTLGYDKYYL